MRIDVSLPALETVVVDPADSALVIVDMENEFLKPGGRHYMAGRAERAIGNLQGLLARAREAGVPRIFIQSLRAPTSGEFTVFGQPHHLLQDTWAVEIVEELAPLPGETIVTKRSNDVWNHTALEATVAALGLRPGRSRILVTGCATNVCVDCAVVGFSVRGFDVAVPVDCTASASEEAELIGYRHYFGRGFENVTPTQSDLIAMRVREPALA